VRGRWTAARAAPARGQTAVVWAAPWPTLNTATTWASRCA
jgi:hypothetical protein